MDSASGVFNPLGVYNLVIVLPKAAWSRGINRIRMKLMPKADAAAVVKRLRDTGQWVLMWLQGPTTPFDCIPNDCAFDLEGTRYNDASRWLSWTSVVNSWPVQNLIDLGVKRSVQRDHDMTYMSALDHMPWPPRVAVPVEQLVPVTE
jgi:hypothetical protein